MAKVQFNCRLQPDIAKWIADEAVRRKMSQADVITGLVVRHGKPQPRKGAKKAKSVRDLRAQAFKTFAR